MTLKILFSEGSSLTAREFVSVLGSSGYWIEILDPSSTCLSRFSRWVKRVHKCPPSNLDPKGYIETVNRVFESGNFDVLLPTHEQAWLFAVAKSKLKAKVALSSPRAFSRVQNKIKFAELLDEIGLPQPAWSVVDSAGEVIKKKPPFYIKVPYSTAGLGVRFVKSSDYAVQIIHALSQISGGQPLMLQSVAEGEYAQVQAIFDQGRLVACHTSIQTAIGIGPSAAGRMSVNHPFAREDIRKIGKYLNWHGGITLDYMYRGTERLYIECNPRTVEPANAAASGVDLPGLQVALSLGDHPDEAPVGRIGVHTHSSLAIILGTGAYIGTRKAVLSNIMELLFHHNIFEKSREILTPVKNDLPSLIPLLTVVAQTLISPRSAVKLSQSAIERYSVTRKAIDEISNIGL